MNPFKNDSLYFKKLYTINRPKIGKQNSEEKKDTFYKAKQISHQIEAIDAQRNGQNEYVLFDSTPDCRIANDDQHGEEFYIEHTLRQLEILSTFINFQNDRI